jgi:hypothetical protein
MIRWFMVFFQRKMLTHMTFTSTVVGASLTADVVIKVGAFAGPLNARIVGDAS